MASSDKLEFACPHCDGRIRVNASAAGRRGKCRHCGESVTVPSAGEPTGGDEPAESEGVELHESVVAALPAGTDRLGACLAFHPANRTLLTIGIVCFGFLVLLFGGMALGIWLTSDSISGAGAIAFYGIFGLLTVGPAVGIFVMRRAGRKWACVFERGLACFDGKKARLLPWEDVEAIYEKQIAVHHAGSYVGTNQELNLRPRAGRDLKLDIAFAEIGLLADLVRELLYDSLRERVDRANRHGEAASFGALGVLPEGLETDGEFLDWSDVSAVRMETETKYQVAVYRDGTKKPWYRCAVPKFPNLCVFLQVVEDRGVAVEAG